MCLYYVKMFVSIQFSHKDFCYVNHIVIFRQQDSVILVHNNSLFKTKQLTKAIILIYKNV